MLGVPQKGHGEAPDSQPLSSGQLTGWSDLEQLDHFVQFHETDDFLLDSVGDFIGAGLGTGAACIVIATPEHRAGLIHRLQANGFDPSSPQARGKYIAADAAQTLSQFLRDGLPDPIHSCDRQSDRKSGKGTETYARFRGDGLSALAGGKSRGGAATGSALERPAQYSASLFALLRLSYVSLYRTRAGESIYPDVWTTLTCHPGRTL